LSFIQAWPIEDRLKILGFLQKNISEQLQNTKQEFMVSYLKYNSDSQNLSTAQNFIKTRMQHENQEAALLLIQKEIDLLRGKKRETGNKVANIAAYRAKNS